MSFSLSDFHPLVLITGDFVSFLVLADILPYGRLSLSSFILLFISNGLVTYKPRLVYFVAYILPGLDR